MTAAGKRDYEVTFTRIGRTGNSAPLTLAASVNDGPAVAVAEDLIEAIHGHARPYIASSVLEIVLSYGSDEEPQPPSADDLDGSTGSLIVGGFRTAGQFTVREVTAR
jgi:hypothetical protein